MEPDLFYIVKCGVTGMPACRHETGIEVPKKSKKIEKGGKGSSPWISRMEMRVYLFGGLPSSLQISLQADWIVGRYPDMTIRCHPETPEPPEANDMETPGSIPDPFWNSLLLTPERIGVSPRSAGAEPPKIRPPQ